MAPSPQGAPRPSCLRPALARPPPAPPPFRPILPMRSIGRACPQLRQLNRERGQRRIQRGTRTGFDLLGEPGKPASHMLGGEVFAHPPSLLRRHVRKRDARIRDAAFDRGERGQESELDGQMVLRLIAVSLCGPVPRGLVAGHDIVAGWAHEQTLLRVIHGFIGKGSSVVGGAEQRGVFHPRRAQSILVGMEELLDARRGLRHARKPRSEQPRLPIRELRRQPRRWNIPERVREPRQEPAGGRRLIGGEPPSPRILDALEAHRFPSGSSHAGL